MNTHKAIVAFSLLAGMMLVAPVWAQDDLPLPTPRSTFYGTFSIGHMIVPASIEQAVPLVYQADVLRKAGKADAAQKLYRQAIAIAPILEAYFHYADYLAAHGNPGKAAEIYNYAIYPLPKTPKSQNSLQPVALFRLALYLSQAGKTQEALRIYQYALLDNDTYLAKLNFVTKQGFDQAQFEAACHFGVGMALTNCTDPDYPTNDYPNDLSYLKELLAAAHAKPDWATPWYVIADKTQMQLSEMPALALTRLAKTEQIGRDADLRYLELAKRPNSGEAPLSILEAASWKDRWFNPAFLKPLAK